MPQASFGGGLPGTIASFNVESRWPFFGFNERFKSLYVDGVDLNDELTGGGTGIGQGIARALAREGARVVVQGFGAVGRHAARFLVGRGALIVVPFVQNERDDG